MKNLSIEVTHALSFLTNTLHDIDKICTDVTSTLTELYGMDLEKDGAPGIMRKKSKDIREKMDEDIDFILSDYRLFQEDMNDIVRNKNNETVIYSLRRFRELYRKYIDARKRLKKTYKKLTIKTDKCSRDKDYVRFIALNKSSVPMYRSIKILDGCIYALEHLLDIKDENKKDDE